MIRNQVKKPQCPLLAASSSSFWFSQAYFVLHSSLKISTSLFGRSVSYFKNFKLELPFGGCSSPSSYLSFGSWSVSVPVRSGSHKNSITAFCFRFFELIRRKPPFSSILRPSFFESLLDSEVLSLVYFASR